MLIEQSFLVAAQKVDHFTRFKRQYSFVADFVEVNCLFAGTKGGSRLFHVASGYGFYSNSLRQTYSVRCHPEGDFVVADTDGPAIYRVDLTALRNRKTLTCFEILELFRTHCGAILEVHNWKSDWTRLDHLSMHF